MSILYRSISRMKSRRWHCRFLAEADLRRSSSWFSPCRFRTYFTETSNGRRNDHIFLSCLAVVWCDVVMTVHTYRCWFSKGCAASNYRSNHHNNKSLIVFTEAISISRMKFLLLFILNVLRRVERKMENVRWKPCIDSCSPWWFWLWDLNRTQPLYF